jgi:hypothetical protein
VIDLPGVTHEIPRESREQQVAHPIVHEVRIAQNQLSPPLVRLVLLVDSFPGMHVVPSASGLLIEISGGSR